jgi:GNAT superfamily N-acetyltransferase
VDLTIRDALRADARAVAEVHVRSWRAAYAGLMPAIVLDGLSVDSRAEMWSRVIGQDSVRLLVLTAPDVVGFASFGPDREEPGRGELYALYLDPTWWGRGAGRMLHDTATQHLDASYPLSMLWVLRGNDRAARFYVATGWRPDGVMRDDEQADGSVLVEDRFVRNRARA